ncbi:glycosyltransferase family 4 protein [Klebsiella sp. 2680]|uniref:glycosyltransferase family 4 protein n=1 Tax=Klebsiella sp. 2680 TaxID=2018037 RepID=UPI001158738C|nr:glycosyltransferase family 4 protein [Klebsiella sp. 2680]
MKKNIDVIILHEYGAHNHYAGLEYFLKSSEIYNKPQYKEFSITRRLLRGIKNKNGALILKTIKNFVWLLISFLFPRTNKNKFVILGMAPLDWRVIYLARILKYSTIIYHSSWIDWSGNNFPKNNSISKKLITNKWKCFLSKRVSSIAAVTNKTADEIRAFLPGDSRNKINVVYHAFDDVFLSNEIKFKTEDLHILFVGRLVRQKGIDKIIELSIRYPNCKFTFVGSGEHYRKILENERGNIHVEGYVESKSELARICSANDIILLPSVKINGWEELFGISLIEAMATGCIPIVTDHMGPKEILNHSNELKQLIFSEEQFINGASSILDRFYYDKTYLREMKQFSRNCAKNFSIKSISICWKNVFDIAKSNF